MIRTQVYLPEDLVSELKYLARLRQVSVADLIRRGAREVVKTDSKNKKTFSEAFVGKGKWTKKTNAVQEINNYYRNFGRNENSN